MYNKWDHHTSKYLMWPKRRSWIDQPGSQPYPPFRSAALNYMGQDQVSWEEQAFAEDTLMHAWPPRSYSCTFCRREFRSAQALGGHMNVHRRDRARLRQEEQSRSGPNSSPAPDEQQSIPNTPPLDNREVHNPSPDNCNISPSSVSIVNYREPNDPNRLAAAQTVYDIDGDEVLSVQNDFTRPAILVVENLKRKDFCRVDQLEDHSISTKRRRITTAEFPLLLRPNLPIQLQQLQKEVTMKSTTGSPIEELDLELRLGNCPTVT